MSIDSLGQYGRQSWSERECLELATGLQKYGSSETAKIAKLIGTKKEDQVKKYIYGQLHLLRKEYLAEKKMHYTNGARPNVSVSTPAEVKGWPTVRKWHKIARNQMTPATEYIKRTDYSKSIMHDMCQDFYEEAEETTNPQMVDVKAIYRFLLDCLSGKNPAELMPKESGIVLMLLKKLKEMKNSLDLEEEEKFILSYKKATKFVPFPLKDEFRKKENKDSEDDSDAVRIPEEVFHTLSRHLKLVESFNPLMVPLWLLDKEQTYLSQVMQPPTEQKNDGKLTKVDQ